MNKITLKLSIKESIVTIWLKRGDKRIGHETLTISQNLDNMLIKSIDNMLVKNKIDRLSLKSLEIQGKMRPEAVSSMVIKTIGSGLEC